MGKFPVKNFKSAGKFSNIFESAANFSKFEKLPIAHRQCGALWLTFLQFCPATPPPRVDNLCGLLKKKRFEKNSKFEI
jgi:hypothetical protein